MKKLPTLFVLALVLTMVMPPAVHAAEPPASSVCYPTSVTRSEDGGEIRKVYDLAPEDDPAGIPRSDFEQEGFRYTLVDLLKQELPENESRQHTETVSVPSKSKDMESVLALLPQTKEFVTDDGLAGVLALQLETVQVSVAGYGNSTREVSATRSYPNLVSQDTSFIPKTVGDGGRTLTLRNISWQAAGDGGDHYTATAVYAGNATSSYVKGYTVTADYSGTVSRIALNKTRYVAIFEGTPLKPVEPEPDPNAPAAQAPAAFNWPLLLAPLGIIAVGGAGIGTALFLKHHKENEEDSE